MNNNITTTNNINNIIKETMNVNLLTIDFYSLLAKKVSNIYKTKKLSKLLFKEIINK